ncbi:M14 family zinc carboxypeptidase, partial [Acidobacteriota bacterium]
MKSVKCFFLCAICVFFVSVLYGQVPKPEDALGFKVGADRQVADMHQIIDYFQKLGKESDRILVKEVGKTTMGNPFIVAIITSAKNHKNLAEYREFQQMLADPRRMTDEKAEELIAKGKTVVMINCSIHASEIGACQMSMELAYDLATKNDLKTKRILDNVILLLTPMHNPDGTQMVVDWYKKYLGTDYEGSPMPWLYNKYVGHDNNRDWYMFTQVESRLTLKVHNAWHPQVIVDMHQMGSFGPRLFIPPYVDPYEPNVDPILRQQVAQMGTFIATELTAEGKGGVIHSDRFDAWTPARAYHHYHGGIRILTEAASIRFATPITIKPDRMSQQMKTATVKMPLPWLGGEWTLRDIVEYDYSAAWAALTNAAGLRENWLRNFYRIHKKAVDPDRSPYAFVIPKAQRDLSTAIKMLGVLQLGGVEIRMAEETFIADGRSYPAGTYIVYIAQPYGGFAKALLERQEYPEIRESQGGPLKTPYDVVAHTLPLLMGVDAIQVDKPFEAKVTLISKVNKPKGKVMPSDTAFGYVWGHETNDDIVALNRLLKQGHSVYWTAEPISVNDKTYPTGTMVVLQEDGLSKVLQDTVNDLHVQFEPLMTNPGGKAYQIRPVKLGLYKSWTASMDEGWTRWVLEQFEFPYKSIVDEDIRRGDLNQSLDVLILPDLRDTAIVKGLSEKSMPSEYAGGIGDVGVKNIQDFVRRGGALIAMNSAAGFCTKRLHLSVTNSVARKGRKDFFIPGSLLKVLNSTDHPIAYGFQRDAAVFFRRSPVFDVNEGVSVARYPSEPFLSGWINGEEFLVNKSAIADVPYEKGRVILIGFPVLYRGQAHGSFKYLFNAI